MVNDRIDEHDVTLLCGAPAVVATGVLRHLHSGALGDLDPLRDLLGVDENAQCAQRIVDWWLAGRRDSPPYPHRPEMRGVMGDLYKQETKTAATDVELEVLVNALAGGEADLFPAAIPAQRMGLARTLVDDFVNGAG